MNTGNLFPSVGPGILKGIPADARAGLPGDDLGSIDRILVDLLLHTHIQILRVLPENHHVNLLKGSLDRMVALGRPDVGVKVVLLSQEYIERAEALSHRGGNGGL